MTVPQWYNERLSEELGRKIAEIIAHRLSDPRVPSVVTVTNIKLAPDTRNATVFVSLFGDEKNIDEAISALNHAAPFIQHVVAESMSIKHMPKLYFKYDKTIAYGEHINELLNSVKDDLV
jgi:ribosome-binding factor A